MDKLTRRDFLKLSTELTKNALLASVVTNALTKTEVTFKDVNVSLDLNFLNHTSDHLLNQEMINQQNTAIILGETSLGDLVEYFDGDINKLDYDVLKIPQSTLEREKREYLVKYGGIGQTENEMMIHRISIMTARDKGIDLVVTDKFVSGLQPELRTNYIKDNETAKFIQHLGTYLGIALIDTAVAFKNDVSLSGLVGTLIITEAPVVKNMVLNSNANPNVVKAVDDLSGEVFELLITNRNLNMVLNTKIIQTMISQNLELANSMGFDTMNGDKIMFYAGGRHVDCRELFETSIQSVSDKIKFSSNQDIDLGLRFIRGLTEYEKKDKRPEYKTINELVNLWQGFVGCYSFPIATFFARQEYQTREDYKLPLSARGIFWNALIERYNFSNEIDKLDVSYLIQLVAEVDIKNFDKDARKLPPINVMYQRMMESKANGKLEILDLRSIVPKFEKENRNIQLVLFEGTPFVFEAPERM